MLSSGKRTRPTRQTLLGAHPIPSQSPHLLTLTSQMMRVALCQLRYIPYPRHPIPIGQKWVPNSHSPCQPFPKGQTLAARPQITESGLFYLTSQCFFKKQNQCQHLKRFHILTNLGSYGIFVSTVFIPICQELAGAEQGLHHTQGMGVSCPPSSPPFLSYIQLAHLI